MLQDKEGWARPWLARKYHYFVDGKSMCGSWLYTGKVCSDVGYSSVDCKRCTRLLEARSATRSKD